MLTLFSCFHANLSYSSIPEHHYPIVIDRCYGLLARLIETFRVKTGIEFSATTLEWVRDLDPALFARLRRLERAGLVEFVGSGYTQNIFPLSPTETNRDNLRLGNAAYARLLGKAPRIAYVHEQAYAGGLVALYREAGARAIVMEWQNAAKYGDIDRALRYVVPTAVAQDGATIPVLWNDSITFQKVQRFVHGSLDEGELVACLRSHDDPESARALCWYGSDLEIFNYRPGDPEYLLADRYADEVARLSRLFALLAEPRRFALALPSEVLRAFASDARVRLESAQTPIVVKKQDKYNATRWAVTGRDNPHINAQCVALAERVRVLDSLSRARRVRPGTQVADLRREACHLFASDFRTNTTDSKHLEFRNRMGAALAAADGLLDAWTAPLAPRSGIALFNPDTDDRDGEPLAVPLTFAPGEFPDGLAVRAGRREVVSQLEAVTRHPDGSLKTADLVCRPSVGAGEVVTLAFRRSPIGPPIASDAVDRIETDAVAVEFLPRKGQTIRALRFPGIAPEPLAGLIPHGFFEDISHSYDLFCGHVVLVDRSGNQITDLEPATFVAGDDGPIRARRVFRVATAAGDIVKTYRVYRDRPRVDLRLEFRFPSIRPISFRVGALTAPPRSFDRDRLRYATVNGGTTVETFPLAGRTVAHDAPVSTRVSATTCVGATEGWLDFGDGAKGIGVVTDKAELFSVFLIHHEAVDDLFYFRAWASVGENDETSELVWRGHNALTLSYVGHGPDLAPVYATARSIRRPLVVIRPRRRSGA
jgi:hypothetical protein